VAELLEVTGELAGECGLTGPLKARKHDHGRRLLGELEPSSLTTEDAYQLLVNDLHDLLGRVQRLGDLGAASALLQPGDEGLDDRQGDVGLE
jgi:hypothetical protein